MSVSPIAGRGDDMQRDAWYSSMRDADDLASPQAIGRYAAERALSLLTLLAVVYARKYYAEYFLYLAYGIAIAYCIRFLRVEKKYFLPVFLMSIIGALAVLSVRGYTTVAILPQLHMGRVHQELLLIQ